MTDNDGHKRQPRLLFRYGMVTSFFEAARDALDPVLQGIDGYRTLGTDEKGRPVAPNHVVRKFANLSKGQNFFYVGACIAATTNLGLAYVHSFRLLSLLTIGTDSLPKKSTHPHLAKLYDALPKTVKDALCEINGNVGSHDFEMELSVGTVPLDRGDGDSSGERSFREQLAYWQSRGMLQDSHLQLADTAEVSTIRLLIPLRSMLVMDQILATQIAPRFELSYRAMDQRMSSRTEHPKLEWDGSTISVSLPDKRGRVMEAKWNPTVTSVVRIREADAGEWSPGFETPFNRCTFMGLKPDTEYDVKVTHKNTAGEGESAISRTKTSTE